MPKQIKKATAKEVAALIKKKSDGRYALGDNLYLRIKDGNASYIVRRMVNGRQREMGLGSAKNVSLAKAREASNNALDAWRDGNDPIRQRRRANSKTFEAYTKECWEEWKKGWKDTHNVDAWLSMMNTYAFPVLGKLELDEITVDDVKKALDPIWFDKYPTAKVVRSHIEMVLHAARANKLTTGQNPAAWKGNLEFILSKAPTKHEPEPRRALPYKEAPELIKRLRQSKSLAAKPLQFAIYTACRSEEATSATWDEINLEARTWTTPSARMKGKKDHAVPLSDAAMAILEGIPDRTGYVFKGQRKGRPVSPKTMLLLLTTLGYRGKDTERVTVHGFRSTFGDWAIDIAGVDIELADRALAHKQKGNVRRAYFRSTQFEARKKLMQEWGEYLASASISE